MEDAKNTDCCFGNCISRDVRRTVNYQFAGSSNSANTTARGKIYQPTNGSNDPFVDQNSDRRIFRFYVREYGVAIR
ncbi:UNVERIFIED_ORG: hypothetical protein GGD51_000656 [Rhizobium esperanzae]